MEIPLIDIAGFSSDDPRARAKVVEQWRDALDHLGFVTIGGHGIPDELMSGVHAAASAFFELSVEHKQVWAAKESSGGPVGYVQLFGEAVGKTHEGVAAPDVSSARPERRPIRTYGRTSRPVSAT